MSSAAGILRSLVASFVLGTASLVAPAHADPPPTVPRIGVLSAQGAFPTLEEGLRSGLRGLGYTEGADLVIDWRRSAGNENQMRILAADLARSRVELIVTLGSPATRATLRATKLPVVFVVGDPVAAGFASSLAKPGGNGTGISALTLELEGKRLEFLHLVAPRARRIVYLRNLSSPIGARMLEETEKAADRLGVKLVTLGAGNASELDAALRAIPRSAADAFLVSGDAFLLANRAQITQAARKAGLPAMYPWREYHEDGALMSYGPDLKDAMRHVAGYVDKILKGAKPADLPIEQVSRYELIIDLRVAHSMGIDVPQELLLRADEVIR